MKKIFLTLIIGFLLSICSFSQDKNNIDIVKKGDALPQFKLESSVYGNIDSEMTKGKVTLINIFATWCPPCQKELKALNDAVLANRLSADKSNKDFALIVVGREHNEDELKAYQAKKNFSFAIYPDPKRDFTSKFATQNIPRTYLVDRNGKIVYTSVGYSENDFEKLIVQIQELLK